MRHITRDRVYSLLIISPSVILIGIFVYGFIAFTGYSSLSKWDALTPDFTFVGLRNYTKLFTIDRFLSDLRNTVTFTLLFLAACLIIGLFLAILLDQRVKGEAVFRSIFLFPMAISYIVTGVVWRWLLNPGTIQTGSSGVNLLFGGGLAQTDFLPGTARNGELLPGSTVDSQTARVALELLPNPTLSVFLGYDRTRNDQRGGIADEGNTFLDASEISLSWTPVPSIYFFGSYRIEKSSEVPEPRRLTTTSLNWSPFPLGTLRLSLRYEEFSDTLLESQSRIYGPAVRWYFNPISYLEVYWESFETESILQRFDRETLAATLRVGF